MSKLTLSEYQACVYYYLWKNCFKEARHLAWEGFNIFDDTF